MAKKPSTLFKEMVEQAKSKLPSSRSANICIGCFAPRNTLTVKPHTFQIFTKEQVQINEDGSRVSATCLYCGEWRHLSLSSYSQDVLKADYPDFDHFVLMKDHKKGCERVLGCSCYVSMVGTKEEFLTPELFKYLEELRSKSLEEAKNAR